MLISEYDFSPIDNYLYDDKNTEYMFHGLDIFNHTLVLNPMVYSCPIGDPSLFNYFKNKFSSLEPYYTYVDEMSKYDRYVLTKYKYNNIAEFITYEQYIAKNQPVDIGVKLHINGYEFIIGRDYNLDVWIEYLSRKKPIKRVNPN